MCRQGRAARSAGNSRAGPPGANLGGRGIGPGSHESGGGQHRWVCGACGCGRGCTSYPCGEGKVDASVGQYLPRVAPSALGDDVAGVLSLHVLPRAGEQGGIQVPQHEKAAPAHARTHRQGPPMAATRAPRPDNRPRLQASSAMAAAVPVPIERNSVEDTSVETGKTRDRPEGNLPILPVGA